MKNALKITLLIIILFLFVLPTGLFADNGDRLLNRQDGRLLTKLEWFSPNGELPGTYEKYLQMHPLKPAYFSQPQNFESSLELVTGSISILVDQDLYSKIKSALNEYILDLQGEGYFVHLQKISGGTPEDIKTWIIERYNTGRRGIRRVHLQTIHVLKGPYGLGR